MPDLIFRELRNSFVAFTNSSNSVKTIQQIQMQMQQYTTGTKLAAGQQQQGSIYIVRIISTSQLTIILYKLAFNKENELGGFFCYFSLYVICKEECFGLAFSLFFVSTRWPIMVRYGDFSSYSFKIALLTLINLLYPLLRLTEEINYTVSNHRNFTTNMKQNKI